MVFNFISNLNFDQYNQHGLFDESMSSFFKNVDHKFYIGFVIGLMGSKCLIVLGVAYQLAMEVG